MKALPALPQETELCLGLAQRRGEGCRKEGGVAERGSTVKLSWIHTGAVLK